MRFTAAITTFFLVALLLIMPYGATSEARRSGEDSGKKSFSALAVLPVAGSTRSVTIDINGYSSQQDAKRLHAILIEGGSDALLKELEGIKSIGQIGMVGRVSFYDFKFIISKPTASGRRIYAVADRPIGFIENYYGTRSKEYPFGILEMELKRDENGNEEGTGTLIYAAQIKVLDDDKVDIENYVFAPIRLLGVRQL